MKRTPKMALTGALAVGMLVAMGGAAVADVSEGQFVSKVGLNCGGQQRITGSTGWGPAEFKQYSWEYYNCSSGSLRRYADINNYPDGTCYGIGPGQARVLAFLWGSPFLPDNRFNGTKSC